MNKRGHKGAIEKEALRRRHRLLEAEKAQEINAYLATRKILRAAEEKLRRGETGEGVVKKYRESEWRLARRLWARGVDPCRLTAADATR